ncbi:MAG: hypothetical protein AABX59_03590 [Nanoarchaeota archaeon]
MDFRQSITVILTALLTFTIIFSGNLKSQIEAKQIDFQDKMIAVAAIFPLVGLEKAGLFNSSEFEKQLEVAMIKFTDSKNEWLQVTSYNTRLIRILDMIAYALLVLIILINVLSPALYLRKFKNRKSKKIIEK